MSVLHHRVSAIGITSALLTLAWPAAPASAQPVIFVDADADAGGNGSSWSEAYQDLQDALDHSRIQPDVEEIWVAEGHYSPDRESGDRFASFDLVKAIGVYGGFAGTEFKRDQRDPFAHLTVLTGDIGAPSNPTDNSEHVVVIQGGAGSTILDGFTITGGYAIESAIGGGVLIEGAGPRLQNCRFENNFASGAGGAIHSTNASFILSDCEFIGSSSGGEGGAVFVSGGSPDMSGCIFLANEAASVAGALLLDNCDIDLTVCEFTRNESLVDAGALAARSSVIDLDQCAFLQNSAVNGGAGAVRLEQSDLSAISTSFTSNSSRTDSGAIRAIDTTLSFREATFAENRSATGGGALLLTGGGAMTIVSSGFHHNESRGGAGGAIYSSGDLAIVIDRSVFESNLAGSGGGGALTAAGGVVNILDCQFLYNSSTSEFGRGPGGALNLSLGVALISRCAFEGNSSSNGGAIAALRGVGQIDLFRCVFDRNTAPGGAGGGISIDDGYSLHADQIDVIENRAGVSGGGIQHGAALLNVQNSRFRGNHSEHDGGAAYLSGPSEFFETTFEVNNSNRIGGAIRAFGSDTLFDGCTFVQNNAAIEGGAAAHTVGGQSIYRHCALVGNVTINGGGGIVSEGHADVEAINSIFIGNQAGFGAGAYCRGGLADFVNCVWYGNHAAVQGGGLLLSGAGFGEGLTVIDNSIFWSNSDPSGVTEQAQITIVEDAALSINHTCLQNWSGLFGGEGSFSADPLFINPPGLDQLLGTSDDDVRLAATSPCIDAGQNGAIPIDIVSDRSGLPRFHDDRNAPDVGSGDPPLVDMGAHEFQGHSLTIFAPSPGRAGEINSTTIEGAIPETRVLLLAGVNSGRATFPTTPGLTIDIARPTLIGVANADRDGRAVISRFVPLNMRGVRILLQGASPISPDVSRVVAHDFK